MVVRFRDRKSHFRFTIKSNDDIARFDLDDRNPGAPSISAAGDGNRAGRPVRIVAARTNHRLEVFLVELQQIVLRSSEAHAQHIRILLQDGNPGLNIDLNRHGIFHLVSRGAANGIVRQTRQEQRPAASIPSYGLPTREVACKIYYPLFFSCSARLSDFAMPSGVRLSCSWARFQALSDRRPFTSRAVRKRVSRSRSRPRLSRPR